MKTDIRHFDVRQFSSDKILKHLDRVNEWVKGGNPAPVTVELDMTNICNHRCPECVVNYFRTADNSSLPLKLAKDIIRQLADNKIRGLIFTGGGEPLCNPWTLEIVEFAKSKGLDLGFITNGSLINKTSAEVILKKCTWLRISLDAASAKTFRMIHGLSGDTFNKVVNNIKLLTKMKKKLKSKTAIGIGYLTCDYTKDEMLDMAVFCKRLGVDYLQFRPLQIRNNGKFGYHITDIKKEIYRCLKQSCDGYKVLYSKHKYDMMKEKNYGRNYRKCYGQQFATVIAANACVYICCHMRGYDKYCIGNLKKHTFSEIWDSKQRKKVVENINFNDCVPLCRDNTFNQILWNIKQPREHVNFL